MALSLGRCNRLGGIIATLTNFSLSTTDVNLTMDADTEKLAVKYYPATTSPITDIDLYLTPTGSVTGVNFKIQVETNGADIPSDTVLGAATTEFAGPSAGGFIGLKTLVTNTGNLTPNTPVWIVLFRSSGASLDASNYIRMARMSVSFEYPKARHYNGTNWTTTSASAYSVCLVIKHADGTYVGMPISSNYGYPTNGGYIYGTNRNGIKIKFGSKVFLRGIQVVLYKTGTPNSLVVSVFEGSTLKYSETILQTSILSATGIPMYFTSPILLASNTDIYITLKQESDGGNSSNYYRSYIYDIASVNYIECLCSPNLRFIYGTGDDPTLYNIETTEVPNINPIIDDPAIDLDEGASGGNSNLWGMIR